MNIYFFLTIFLGVFIEDAWSDVYLHNPRGSNNRWNENKRARNNANRMFDSQNNDRGGYNVGNLYYYTGSKLQIEWTNQHSCGDQNNHCDIILQYMCHNQLRDGSSTSTIPDNPANCKNLDCNEDRRYGMHEDFYSFAHCRLRSRNEGLFTADQKLRQAATSTRQNPNENRFAYECPEERDYYPYWGPTEWRDIAVLTNDVSRCPLYLVESQNVKDKYACDIGNAYLYQNVRNNRRKGTIPNNKEDCEEFKITENGNTINGTWRLYPAHGISAPHCAESQPSRDNHLGNGIGGETLNYNWTIPDHVHEHCALRIRYNISTSDYARDETTSESNNRNQDTDPGVDVWSRYGLTEEEGKERGYTLENNPEVKIFNFDTPALSDKLDLQLAVNTAQFGRTFEDRTHRFAIRPRPSSLDGGVIHNVNVRGKRGNIVQVYPAVEYDFVPNKVLAQNDVDYVHIQWTGSDNNPGNNDGQGRASTDRSNLVLLADPTYLEGNPETYKVSTFGQLGSSYPNYLDVADVGGFSRNDLLSLATLRDGHFGGDMDELNDAGTYFDLGPRKVTRSGTYHYMCTRNNNFSNRSQKGKLIVTNSAYTQQRIDATGGSLVISDPSGGNLAVVDVPPQAISSATSLELWNIAPEDADVETQPPNTDYISSFVYLGPPEKLTKEDMHITVQIKLSDSVPGLHEISVYRSNSDTTAWDELAISSHENQVVSFVTDRGGVFVVSKSVAAGPVAGLVIGLLVGIILIAVAIKVLRSKSLICAGYKDKI